MTESTALSTEPVGSAAGLPVRELGDRVVIGWTAHDLERITKYLHSARLTNDAAADPNCPDGSACWDEENGWHTRSGDSGIPILLMTLVVGGIIVIAVLVECFANLLRGKTAVGPLSFPNLPGDDHDVVTFANEAGQPGLLTVTMKTPASVTWWKSADVFNHKGDHLGPKLGAWTQDSHHDGTVQIPVPDPGDMKNWFLVLSKAKLFGVHTGMYAMLNLSGMDGRHLTFTWQRD